MKHANYYFRLGIFFAFFFAALILSYNAAQSQWVQASGHGGSTVLAFAVSGTNLFAGTSDGVILSTDNGTSWTAVDSGLTNMSVRSLAASAGGGGTNLFAGTDGGGVFLSTNNGTSWTLVDSGLTNTDVRSLAVSPNGTGETNLFAGTYGGGVFLSTNNGTSWTAVDSGLTYNSVGALAVSGTNLFAGTDGGVWRRPLSEMITSVQEIHGSGMLKDFALEQNHPNPFNPSTTIEFSLPRSGNVSLKVFNLLGQEVATLVNGERSAGRYEVVWNASHLSSGVYFYRLNAGKFSEVRKLILTK